MILPGTIPETPISCEWSQRLERPPDQILYGGFVNSAVQRYSQSRCSAFCPGADPGFDQEAPGPEP